MDFSFRDNSTVADIAGVPEKYRGLYAFCARSPSMPQGLSEEA